MTDKPIDIKKKARKATKGRVKLLHALPYLGCMVYVLQIDDTLFTYHALINNQMYFSYVEGEYEKGKKEFTEAQIKGYVGIVLATAHATVETVTGKVNKKDQALGEVVINAAEAAWYSKKNKGGAKLAN